MYSLICVFQRLNTLICRFCSAKIQMMRKVAFLIFTVCTFIACTESLNTSKPSTNELAQNEKKNKALKEQLKGLYSYQGNRSSIIFEITETEDQVFGKLIYSIAEKDKNSGMFSGQLIGNKIIGDYVFQSEGKESTRQVAFALKDKQLIEGYGLMNERGDAFMDTSKIDYSSNMPLSKIK